MRYYSRTALRTVALVSLVACASPDATIPGIAARDSAGVRIVTNDSAQQASMPWTVADSAFLTVGDPSDVETFLPAVTGARLLSDGRVAIAEAASNLVRIFGANGEFDVAFGGAGSGPGRFRSIGNIWVDAADTIFAASVRDSRIHVFTADGTLVRTITLEAPLGVLSPNPIGGLANGAIIAWSLVPRPADRVPGNVFTDSLLLHRFAGDGSFDRTMLRMSIAPVLRVQSEMGGERDVGAPLHPFPVFAVTDSLVVAGAATEGDVIVLNDAGTMTRRIRWPAQHRSLSVAMRDTIFAGLASAVGVEVAELSSRFVMPDRYPAYETVLVDDLGYIWVGVGLNLNETSFFDIFFPDGRWLGRLRTPPGLRLLHVGQDFMLGVRRDQNAGDRIEGYSLVRSGGGPGPGQ